MLVECGLVRATTDDGLEFVFRPSFGRIASLGSPHEIVELYARLHGADAEATSAYVLAGLCDQEDASALIGWRDEDGWHDGKMPPAERVIIARHLMHHGIVGRAKPESADPGEAGAYTDRFEAAEFIAAAQVHLGLSRDDAEGLSMSEFQRLLDIKFPRKRAGREVPSREAYDRAMAALKARNEARSQAANDATTDARAP